MQWQGFALTVCFAFMLAIYTVLNKKLILRGLSDECVSVVNFLGAGSVLLVASFMIDPPRVTTWLSWTNGYFWSLAPTAMLNIVIMYGNVKALKYGDVSLVGPIAAAQPMIVIIPSFLILGEVPGKWGYVGLLLLAVGMYVFSFAEEVKGWTPPKYLRWVGEFSRYLAPWYMLFRNKGVQIALIVAVCGAVSINFDKLSALRAQSFLFTPALILLFIGGVGLIKTSRGRQWASVRRGHIARLALNPIVLASAVALGWLAFGFGMAAYAGALRRLVIIFDVALAWFLLNEKMAIKRWPGAIIMAIGAACIGLD